MTSFRLAFHEITGRRIVEVWDGEEFIAGIYPAVRGVQVVSKHPMEIAKDNEPPAAVLVEFGRAT